MPPCFGCSMILLLLPCTCGYPLQWRLLFTFRFSTPGPEARTPHTYNQDEAGRPSWPTGQHYWSCRGRGEIVSIALGRGVRIYGAYIPLGSDSSPFSRRARSCAPACLSPQPLHKQALLTKLICMGPSSYLDKQQCSTLPESCLSLCLSCHWIRHCITHPCG